MSLHSSMIWLVSKDVFSNNRLSMLLLRSHPLYGMGRHMWASFHFYLISSTYWPHQPRTLKQGRCSTCRYFIGSRMGILWRTWKSSLQSCSRDSSSNLALLWGSECGIVRCSSFPTHRNHLSEKQPNCTWTRYPIWWRHAWLDYRSWFEFHRHKWAVGLSVSRGLFWNPVGYPWDNLCQGAIVNDVGGGLGHISMELYKRYSHLNFRLQDLPAQTEHAQKVIWPKECPQAIAEGRIEFKPIDLFVESPIPNCDIYLVSISPPGHWLRLYIFGKLAEECHVRRWMLPWPWVWILTMVFSHLLPDKAAITTLSNIRKVMSSTSRVLVRESAFQDTKPNQKLMCK